MAVTTAEVTDRKGALQAMRRCKTNLCKIQNVLADSGYVGQPFAQAVKETLGEEVTVQIAKRSELHKFAVIPKRWVVERSFAWLDKNRRLWKNCDPASFSRTSSHAATRLLSFATGVRNPMAVCMRTWL